MGILNTTPDSFSDGGRWEGVDRAVAHAERMLAEGADIIDVGGESSRPGAKSVDADEEIRRTVPVIEQLAGRCVISIDTTKPDVAEAAVAAGAHIINDVSASLHEVAASTKAGWVAMHMQGVPATMQDDPLYDDVVAQVADHLDAAAKRGEEAGVEHLWVDPCIGFGKLTSHNVQLLRNLSKFATVERRLLIGVSRKRIIAELHAMSDEGDEQIAITDRREASVFAAVWAWLHGAHIVRVHDVRASSLAAQHIRHMAAPLRYPPSVTPNETDLDGTEPETKRKMGARH